MKSRNTFKLVSIYSLMILSVMTFVACGSEPEEVGEQSATSQTGENAYPEDKVLENTNLDDDKPLALDGPFHLQQKKLMAMLNHQKTDLEMQINNLEAQQGNSESSNTITESVEKMKLYVEKLDKEMAQVYGTEEENFENVAETAQAAIEGAGALIASRDMRISKSF